MREISTNAQIAFDLSQRKLEQLFNEATQNAGRVDTQVREMNELKSAIDVKIAQHEAAIIASGQVAEGAHSRLTALMSELEGFSGRTESLSADVKTFRGNLELWYSGIKAHVEKNGGGGDGKGKGGSSGEGKGSTRIDKKDIAVSKLPDDLDKLSFRHWVDAVDQQLEAVHGFKHATFVMSENRRSDAEITADTFRTCIEKANMKIEQICRRLASRAMS